MLMRPRRGSCDCVSHSIPSRPCLRCCCCCCLRAQSDEVRTGLGELFDKKGIPMLYIVGADGVLITKEGRQAVAKEKEAAIRGWTAALMPAAAAAKPADAFTLDEDF